MQWGLSFLINPEPPANRPLRRFPGLGASQFLLLDRSGEARGRRLRDTTAAILRRTGRSRCSARFESVVYDHDGMMVTHFLASYLRRIIAADPRHQSRCREWGTRVAKSLSHCLLSR